MSRNKTNPDNDVPHPKKFSLTQVEMIIRNVLKLNYNKSNISEYGIHVSPDGTRVVLNAVINTPFPTFEEVK